MKIKLTKSEAMALVGSRRLNERIQREVDENNKAIMKLQDANGALVAEANGHTREVLNAIAGDQDLEEDIPLNFTMERHHDGTATITWQDEKKEQPKEPAVAKAAAMLAKKLEPAQPPEQKPEAPGAITDAPEEPKQ